MSYYDAIGKMLEEFDDDGLNRMIDILTEERNRREYLAWAKKEIKHLFPPPPLEIPPPPTIF